jgi:hypothetical protein
LFNEDGTEYDQLAILNDDYTLNKEKLEEQGLPYYATAQVITNIAMSLSFGATSAYSPISKYSHT